MTNPLEKVAEAAIERAAKQLMKLLRGRTPEDSHYACTTVTIPQTKQRVRICVEPGWRSETREDPTTGAPVTVHVSPEYSKRQVREAVNHEAQRDQERLPPASDAAAR